MFFYISNYMVGKVKKLLGLDRISGSAGLSGRISGYPAIKRRISGNIRQGTPDNPAGYPASGKKNQIRPNPNFFFKGAQDLFYLFYPGQNRKVLSNPSLEAIGVQSNITFLAHEGCLAVPFSLQVTKLAVPFLSLSYPNNPMTNTIITSGPFLGGYRVIIICSSSFGRIQV